MEEKKKFLLKYITTEQIKRSKDKRSYLNPKSITIQAETERAAIYALWAGPKGLDVDHIVSVTEIKTDMEAASHVQYKIGWYGEDDKRRYKVVETKAEALDLITGLMDYPGQISVKQVTTVNL